MALLAVNQRLRPSHLEWVWVETTPLPNGVRISTKMMYDANLDAFKTLSFAPLPFTKIKGWKDMLGVEHPGPISSTGSLEIEV